MLDFERKGMYFHHTNYGSLGGFHPGDHVPENVLFPIRITDFEGHLHVPNERGCPSVGEEMEIDGKEVRITFAEIAKSLLQPAERGPEHPLGVRFQAEPLTGEDKIEEADKRGRLKEYSKLLLRTI